MFIIILIITALSIAGSAAFFTMYGLAVTFASGFWPVLIGGASIEAGKLVMASYVYRYWNHIKWFFKPIYIMLILVAMVFTSIGVFGYLSSAYQKDVLPLNEIQSNVEILEQKVSTIQQLKDEQVIQRQRMLDDKSKELAALPEKYATKKAEVSQRYKPLLEKVNQDIDNYNLQLRTLIDEKQTLKISVIQQESKTGPIIFVAEVFGWDVDEAVKWLIMIIVTIFDPMAVMLIIGVNTVIVERQAHKSRRRDDRVHVADEALETAVVQPQQVIIPSAAVVDENSPENMPIEDVRELLSSMAGQKLSREEGQLKRILEEALAKKVLSEKLNSR